MMIEMKLNDQLIKNLQDLGFVEIKTDLYCKEISENTKIYRDYRESSPSTYAYFRAKSIDPYQFKEAKALDKIEESYKEDTDSLKAFA